MTALASLALFGQGLAQEVSDIPVGYCGGELPKAGTIRSSESESWVSGAIYIPASTLNTFGGNQITGVHAGLASRLNIEELTVWLRSELDGENIVEQTITKDTDPEILKGWNTVNFDTPWDIPSNSTDGLYIGYSFFQKKTTFGLATLDTPIKNALFVKLGEEPWEDLSDEGTLCVEGLIRGDKLPKVNASLLNITADEVYIIDRGTIEVTGTVQNLATYTITGFDVNALVNDSKVATEHVDVEIPFGQSGQFVVTLPLGITTIGDGTGSVTINIDNINEGADEDPSDNTLTTDFRIVQHDFKHRIIVEEFTTEQCPNCPRVAGYMHDGLEKEEFAEDVIAICHHSGYYTDWLTNPFDNDYMWFYNAGGSTYAPAIMVDRDARNDDTPVFNPTSSSELEQRWRSALRKPAFISLNISAEYDAEDENKLKVRVIGARSMADFCENPRIFVYLVENDIAAHNQAGAGSDFIHQHVNRAVNTTWGDPMEFYSDTYEYNCEFNLSTFWVRENMQIVAFVSNFNNQDPTDCLIQNASRIYFSEIKGLEESGIETIDSDNEVEIYSLSGIRVKQDNLAPGIYIKRSGNKTEKFVVR